MEHAEITERSEKVFFAWRRALARHLSRFAEETSSKNKKAPTGVGAPNIVLQKRKASSEEPGRTSLHHKSY